MMGIRVHTRIWLMIGLCALGTAAVVAIGRSGALSGDPARAAVPAAATPQDVCVQGAKDYGATVLRSERAVASLVAQWDLDRFTNAPNRPTSSPYAWRPANEPQVVCVYQGRFNTPRPRGAPEATRMIVIIDPTGTVTMDYAGPAGNVITTPVDYAEAHHLPLAVPPH